MTKEMAASKTQHPWSADALLAKAQRHAQEMLSNSTEDWNFGLTSTFVLEFLARAALAKVSPTLLAETKDWSNIYFALGYAPTTPKFVPRSIDITEAFSRLGKILPEFTPEWMNFALQHVNRRNEELHTGATPFDGVRTDWLGPFYKTCTVLLSFLEEDLAYLVGAEQSQAATSLIAASLDESAKTVLKAIAAHKTVWDSTGTEEREKAMQQASVWAARQTGHRVPCPSCGNDALLDGTPISEPTRKIEGDLIVETQQYLPSKFECIACRLKISGLSQLNACGLGKPYKSTSTYEWTEYFSADDLYAGYEDDNNEY